MGSCVITRSFLNLQALVRELMRNWFSHSLIPRSISVLRIAEIYAFTVLDFSSLFTRNAVKRTSLCSQVSGFSSSLKKNWLKIFQIQWYVCRIESLQCSALKCSTISSISRVDKVDDADDADDEEDFLPFFLPPTSK